MNNNYQNHELEKEDEGEDEDVNETIIKNNYKLTADKIKEKLSKILNDPSQSSKRWVWELVQNAKDVKNRFGEVSIQIELSEDRLEFRHNGNPFKMPNVTGLIQQVSSKDSSNADEEVTGKFGTGFIATHLLSEVIDVEGVIKYRNTCRKLGLRLDRSGRTSEELLPKIQEALELIRKIEDDSIFPRIEDYETNRKESDLDTCFSYGLINPEKKQAAADGIKDLENTLPLTLVNIPKIKNVTIINDTNNITSTYTCSIISDVDSIRKTEIKISNQPTRNFITYHNDQLSLSVEVDDFDNLSLKAYYGKTPNLYRDFPLIGSDKFYFPFILNGYNFNPLEDRSGIPIHSDSAAEHTENREIVEKAFEAAKKFTAYLLNVNAKNLFICGHSRLPDEKWQPSSKQWYLNLQKDYRTYLNTQALCETDLVNRSLLSDIFVPNYGEKNEDKLKFYDIVKSFIGGNKVPKKDILLDWIKAVGPKEELETWDRSIVYSLENLLKELEVVGSVEELKTKLEGNTDPIKWLNQLYAFLISYKETDSFKAYAIIPNQDGIFKKLIPNQLHLEDVEANIPDEFLDVLEKLGDNWRVKLIHRDVQLPEQNIEKEKLSDVSAKIKELIERKEFERNENKLSIIIDILRNVKSLESANIVVEIFKKGKELLGFSENIRVVSNLTDFNFQPALEIYIRAIHSKIQESINLEGLSKQLGKDKDRTTIWLDSYLSKLLNNKENKALIEYGNIIPNRYGDFCAYDALENFEINEASNKLIDILFKLDNGVDWKKDLVMDGIKTTNSSRDFSQLAAAINESIREIEKEEAVNVGYIKSYKEVIFELIEWCNAYTDKAISLGDFMQKKNDLWVKLSMTDELLSILKDDEALDTLKIIKDSEVSQKQLVDLLALFPNGVSDNVIKYAQEDARKKREFNNLLEVGSKVERLFIESLEQFEVITNRNDIIHAGAGAYDIRITNNENGKSFYIELKSCRNQNTDPISVAISQATKAVKEKDNNSFGIVVIERTSDNNIDDNYIRNNTMYLKNPGIHLTSIVDNYNSIDEKVNTENSIDLKMDNADFKGTLDYDWIKEKTKESGFNELIQDILASLN